MAHYRHHSLIVARGGQRGGLPPASGETRDEGRINFAEIWHTIRRGKWIILLTTLVVAGIIGAYTYTLPPVYESSAIVFVDTRGSGNAPVSVAAFTPIERRALSNELGILRNSAELATRVAEAIVATAETAGAKDRFPILAPTEDGREPSIREIAFRLRERVRFSPLSDQDMIVITAESTTPEEAAVIANRYAEEYERYSRERSRESLAAAREFVEKQVEQRRQELEELERQWEAFARSRQVVRLGPQGERLVAEVAQLEAQRDAARFQLEQEKSALQFIEQELQKLEPGLVDELVKSRQVSTLEAQIDALSKKIAELKVQAEQYYVFNPKLRGNEEKLGDQQLVEIVRQIDHFEKQREQLQAQLVKEMIGRDSQAPASEPLSYVEQLRARRIEKQLAIQELERQVEAFNQELAKYEDQLARLPRQQIELEQLERRRAMAEQWYTTFVQELQRIMIAEQSELGYVKIVSSAFVPTVPVRPNRAQNIVLGILIGLGLGLGLAFLRQAMHTQLDDPEKVREHGYTLLGVVPAMEPYIRKHFRGRKVVEVDERPRSTTLITLLDPWSPIAENFRLIRTNLQQHTPAKGRAVTWLVTSPEMGDGKTVVAANLAVATAHGGQRTLLIDADLRRPRAHEVLGVADQPGLSELLLGKVRPDPESWATDIPNLYFLPAGVVDQPPPELLGSQRMVQLLEFLRKHFDVIVIDSPPVLAVTDSVLLAQLCEATLMVISAGRTDAKALDIARQTLESVNVSIAGVIFNRYRADKHKGYAYGYGYGRRYHKGYGYYAREAAAG